MRRTVRTADRPEHEILGRVLREARESAGLTQRELAKRLDRTQAYVWKIETGIQHIDIATLFDLADFLGTSVEELVKRLTVEVSSLQRKQEISRGART